MKKACFGLLALALLWASPAPAVVSSTAVGNANYTILPTDQRVWVTVAFSASRTFTLPAAGATCIGQTCPAAALEIIDQSGVNGAFTLTITPATGDTINGSTNSLVISSAGQRIVLIPISGTNWITFITPNGLGTATNDNACAGCIGEFISTEMTSTTTGGVVLANATAAGVTGITITPGDWDCRALGKYNPAGATITSLFSVWTSSASGTAYAVTGLAENGAVTTISLSPANIVGSGAGFNIRLPVDPVRYSIAAATSVFLNVQAGFTTGAASAYGFLGCRRMR